MIDKYILNAKGEPVPERDLMKWARWFESKGRIVKQEWVENVRVSTVFLNPAGDWRQSWKRYVGSVHGRPHGEHNPAGAARPGGHD